MVSTSTPSPAPLSAAAQTIVNEVAAQLPPITPSQAASISALLGGAR